MPCIGASTSIGPAGQTGQVVGKAMGKRPTPAHRATPLADNISGTICVLHEKSTGTGQSHGGNRHSPTASQFSALFEGCRNENHPKEDTPMASKIAALLNRLTLLDVEAL